MKLQYLLIFLLLISCRLANNNEDNEAPVGVETSQLVPGDVIRFSADSLTLPKSECIKYYQFGSREYLAYLSKNAINLYDFASTNLIKKISLESEGPDGVGYINGFHFWSLDSILVFPSEPVFHLINSDGRILKSINYSRDTLGVYRGFTTVGTEYNSEIFLKDEKIYLPLTPQGLWSQMSEKELFSQPSFLIIDTVVDQIYGSQLGFPDDYFKNGRQDMVSSVVFDGEKVVLSLIGSEYLYTSYDLKSYKEKKWAGSNVETKQIEPLQPDDISSYIEHAITNNSFKSLLFDPYRKLYYRFAALAYDLKAQENSNFLLRYPPRQSIIMLDSELRKINETYLPVDTYVFNNSFVGPKGLYISLNHPNSEAFDQDFIAFQRFELSNR